LWATAGGTPAGPGELDSDRARVALLGAMTMAAADALFPGLKKLPCRAPAATAERFAAEALEAGRTTRRQEARRGPRLVKD
jgi:hypothetical protein